jgi:hypothetical protein
LSKFAAITGLRLEFGWFCLATANLQLFSQNPVILED